MQPGRWYRVTLPLAAYDTVIPAGHVLGLVVGQSDPSYTSVQSTRAVVDVDLAASALTLPVVGRTLLPDPTLAPPVTTTTPRSPAHRTEPPQLFKLPHPAS